MTDSEHPILVQLRAVRQERERRMQSAPWIAKVQAIKAYQHKRFASTYADLLASARHGPAARFFLEELYGPNDFTQRDAQFARVVPALVRLFPDEIVRTVQTLTSLHALSEALDSEMGALLASEAVDSSAYIAAWQGTGRPADRERQIALMLSVGEALDRLTRKPLVRATLAMMRGPARAAGLGELQRLLEAGFDTFRAMRGAQEFLATIGKCERSLCTALFSWRIGDINLGELP
jgi:hypothetical protein